MCFAFFQAQCFKVLGSFNIHFFSRGLLYQPTFFWQKILKHNYENTND
jgi:hypothetical protein